ncbi:GTP cyclohydrolase I FolE [Tritonibacter scottomollicae]|uniref:GTP cyclohydrolase I FolE n=1 Tax=Tritonibacter scottomollicae TaxID=483013 RepID=UPI003AA9A5F2
MTFGLSETGISLQNGIHHSVDDDVSQAQAEESVRNLLRWIGEDPDREGLVETPKRVVKAFAEWFSGYDQRPDAILSKNFGEVNGYRGMVLLRGIRLESYCEHHLAPIIGTAHIAYLPNDRVVGISKLARLVDLYAKRLQIQERLTSQIANCLNDELNPRGVAVMICAEHQCMSTRGVRKHGVDTITSEFIGKFETDKCLQSRFWQSVEA